MHDRLLGIWYGGRGGGTWLAPLAGLFGRVAAWRRAWYRRGWLSRYCSRRPVVVVGNLTVGGTGKTPLVIWLAQGLHARGLAVGVACRGYGGAGGPARLVSAADRAADVGDEPLLIGRRLGVPVAIGARRADAVRLLEDNCEVILCDDGLQHEALGRDFEIAVVDGARGLGNGRLLPAGPLREPAARLGTVDAVVVHGPGFAWPGAIAMELVPVAAVALHGGERRPLAQFSGRKVRAIAAIGHPERFFEMLRRHGIEVVARALPDHAAIDAGAIGDRAGLPLLMTEKDAVKCPPDAWPDAWAVEVVARLAEPGSTALIERVARLAGQPPRGYPHGD